jgi:hypothetical protein
MILLYLKKWNKGRMCDLEDREERNCLKDRNQGGPSLISLPDKSNATAQENWCRVRHRPWRDNSARRCVRAKFATLPESAAVPLPEEDKGMAKQETMFSKVDSQKSTVT